MGNGHEAAACLWAPSLVTGGTRILFLDCPLEWHVPEHPRLVSHSFFLPYPFPLDTFQFLKHHSVAGALIIGGVTLRKEAGGGNPITWTHGAQGAFHSSSSPEAPHPVGAVGVVSLQEDPPGSGDCGPVQRGTGTPGPWGRVHDRHILPSSFSPKTVLPRDPSLPRLQGCDSSPGH